MEEIQDILNQYNIKKFKLEKIKKGHTQNEIYEILNEEKSKKYILKCYFNMSCERLNYLNNLQKKLEVGPRIINTLNEENYLIKENKKYILYDFIEGRQLNKNEINKDYAGKMGMFIGKLHNDMEKIKLQSNQNALLNIESPNIEKMNQLLITTQSEELRTLLIEKIEILKKINFNQIYNYMNKNNRELVHGDIYLDNLLFTNDFIRIIDFDQAGLFYQEYEMARAMFMICFNEKDTTEKNLEKMQEFLRKYCIEKPSISITNAINLYVYSNANSLYCYSDWDIESQEMKKHATFKNKLLKWIIQNNSKIIIRNDINELYR